MADKKQIFYDLNDSAAAINETLNELIGEKSSKKIQAMLMLDRPDELPDEAMSKIIAKTLPKRTFTILEDLDNSLAERDIDEKENYYIGIDKKDGNEFHSLVAKLITFPKEKEIDANLNQFIIGDGNKWAQRTFVYGDTYFSGYREENNTAGPYLEYRFGPRFEGRDQAYTQSPIDLTRFVISNNNLVTRTKNEKTGTIIQSINSDADYYKLSLQDKAHAIFKGASDTIIGGTAKVYIDGASNVFIHDSAKVNIDHRPEIYIHDNAKINFDASATIQMHDTANFTMQKNSQMTLSDIAQVFINGSSYTYIGESAKLYFEGVSKTHMRENALFFMNDAAYFNMQYDYRGTDADKKGPSFCLNGGCGIIMNDNKHSAYAPLIMADNDAFLFVGDAISPHSAGYDDPGKVSLSGKFNSILEFKKSLTNSPRVKFANDSLIMIESQTPYAGGNFIKICSSQGRFNQINILDASTIEMRQESIFALRGNSQEIYPWEDQFERYNKIIPSVTTNPYGGGSALLMQGNPIFHMRSVVDTSKWKIDYTVAIESALPKIEIDPDAPYKRLVAQVGNEYYYKSVTASTDTSGKTTYTAVWKKWDGISYPQSTNSPILEILDNADVRANKNIRFHIFDDAKMDITDSVEVFLHDNARFNMDNTSELYLHNNAHLHLDRDTQLFMHDNAEINFSENASIVANDNGITFSNGKKSVSFSIDELEKLKTLLSGD